MALRKKERLADAIRAEVSRVILFEMTDPRLGFITVTGVDITGDLKTATVKISILGDEKARAITMSVIRHARGYIQKQIGERIVTRFVPIISFAEDDSVRKSIRLSKALRDAMEK
jgi:ribosome-binding factor A